jgi:hypothetical protein
MRFERKAYSFLTSMLNMYTSLLLIHKVVFVPELIVVLLKMQVQNSTVISSRVPMISLLCFCTGGSLECEFLSL